MTIQIILSIISAYFLISGAYRIRNKNIENTYLPDENINRFIRKLDNTTYLFGFTSIILGILIGLLIVIHFLPPHKSIFQDTFQLSGAKFYYISLILFLSGLFSTLLASNGTGNICGDLMLIKRDIIYYYEIQNFKTNTAWQDYPNYTGYKKDYYLKEISILNTRYYLIVIGKIMFFMGAVGIFFSFQFIFI
jgi:hypothetical protein